jgi:hypothetical protein
MAKTTIAYVRWFDSCITFDNPYTEKKLPKPHEMESCGILLKERKKSIVLALDRTMRTDNPRMLITIPRANIRWMKNVKVRKK